MQVKLSMLLFPFGEHTLQSEVPSRVFALYNLLGPPSLNCYV